MFEADLKTNLSIISSDPDLPDTYVKEVIVQHQKKSRHYHTLIHLRSIWEELQPVRMLIQDWPVMLFAIAYHDFEYNILRNDNEEKSAEVAVKKLMRLNLTTEQLNRCRQHILATKGHTVSEDNDCNFFTDADLSVLGADPDVYRFYSKNVRKEYRYYPDLLYKPGRKKVLKFFLDMPRIYKTDHFFNLYEDQARFNLSEELNKLA